ncbi:DNA-binding protein [Pseudomonas stutzeri]|nr:DNA-binding protein [Stutzerimonas stutzeri]
MARGGINKALVQKARQALLARGEHPSIDAVRMELGNTGSKTTIHRYLRELEEAAAGQGTAAPPLGEELVALVAQLAERLQQEAWAAVAGEREELAGERAGYLQQLEQAAARIRQLEADKAALDAQLQQAQRAHAEEREQRQAAEVEVARLVQAGEDHCLRLADRDAQIHSLEDKHRHAREALEHYRAASREQREQEQRRHEAQVQQLQMELRQLQQSLIVRQDELTRLNRDNERFVTENAQMRRDMAAQHDRLQRRERELGESTARLAQAEAGRELLQARTADLQAEAQRLGEALLAQSAQTQALQVGLSEMAARFSALQSAPLTSAVATAAGDPAAGDPAAGVPAAGAEERPTADAESRAGEGGR